MDKETRYTINGELRANDPTGTTPEDSAPTEEDKKEKVDNKDGKKISGYAIVFNKPSKPIPDGDNSFVEIIDPKALENTDLSDVVMLSNHDYSKPLATVKAGTLKLNVDEKGLHFEATLPNTTDGADTFENVKAGNIDSASFRFANATDQWSKDENGNITRTITNIGDIFEISSVTIPTYDDSSVEVAKRSFDQFLNSNKEKKDTKNMTEKILIDNDTKTAELRSFESYVKSRGEVRDGLTTVEGAPLVPSEIVTPIFSAKENSVDLASYVNKKSVSTKSGSYPIAKNNNAILATKEELAEIGEVDAGISAIDFNVTTKAGKIYLSSELVADSNFDVESEVKAQLERLVVNTNNKNIMDLLNKLEAKTATDLDGIKHIYNVDLDPSLEKMIIVNQTSFDYLDTLKDSDGRYLLQYSVADPTQSTLFGAKIVVVPDTVLNPVQGEVTMFMGSLFDYVAIFQRDQITAKWTNFDSYSEGLSVILRNDYQVVDDSAMVKVTLKTATK
ncbi:phage major capsid protein [Pediococcus acidilactici]|uniref:phage major capsid protein n=1 Tax=Pediococcus acidilactici TaxID=1254 RepID=UPI001F350CBC|nr:phage major capsid protein [Pediococcus acidilactici]MCF4062125.1 phage major capsid protein [Pediococcus acidilactici]